jgi:phosphoribosylformimino-5-aminoimidazole carboxamide ribotide isomerase
LNPRLLIFHPQCQFFYKKFFVKKISQLQKPIEDKSRLAAMLAKVLKEFSTLQKSKLKVKKMLIFPAIDLKSGQCVRLLKGDMNQATIFNNNPAAQAKEFEDLGFKFLHVIDLDGAISGTSVNENSVKEILKNVKIPIQLGGGIRSIETIAKWLELGVNRVILGTIAAKNPELVKEACKKFPGKIVIGIDAKDGFVATEGWVNSSEIFVLELAKQYANCGAAAIIYTDISRDGTLSGMDVDGTRILAQNLKIPVIASGGISNLEDILKIKALEKNGVVGVIIGRALYDKKIPTQDLVDLI